ncbi:MAG TPA: glycosyltransferase [Solirubrobacteraceae bacterium]|nr:glycosyltransferase [Solirubrobacteraceae bacterium]
MRVLIFHGYLLHGTGSNVYNAELGRALVQAGHELHVLCQDRSPLDLSWVDAAGDWDGGALKLTVRRDPPRATVYRPDIGGLLPVYVADRYEGVEARPFSELSVDEVAGYVERNVAAVAEVVARARPDVALANHLVMGPLILARALAAAGVPYAVKIHGSALEYTVKPHPRFLPAAREGLAGARGVLVGSRHTAESLWAALQEPGLQDRTRLGPPGVDVGRFAPRERDAAAAGLAALRARLEQAGGRERAAAAGLGAVGGSATSRSSFARSSAEAAAALGAVDPRRDRLVVYVGKLIASKGVELLLAAWPFVLARVPDARLLVVGFGAFRDALEGLAGALARGDLEAARALRGEDGRELPELAAFLDGLGAEAGSYRAAAAAVAGSVHWAGRLEHSELADVLPAADAMAMPSTFPEAFGMVAAEAAACGALPVVAGHSGMVEVARALGAAVPPEVPPWLTFEVGPHAVTQLADGLASWLAAPPEVRAATREAIVGIARERYSWDGVARTVLAAAEGRLDDLPRP